MPHTLHVTCQSCRREGKEAHKYDVGPDDIKTTKKGSYWAKYVCETHNRNCPIFLKKADAENLLSSQSPKETITSS